MATPSGQPPIYLPPYLYAAAEKAGFDMRWYVKLPAMVGRK